MRAPVRREGGGAYAALIRRDLADIHRAFGVPSIIGGLHPQPNVGAVAERLAEPDGHFGRETGFFLVEDVVEMLARNAKRFGDFRLAHAKRGQDVLPQHFSGVHRAPLRVPLRGILNHNIHHFTYIHTGGISGQWYCSKSTRLALSPSNSNVTHHGPLM